MLAIATIGPLLERQVRRSLTWRPAGGVILDAIGTISLRSFASHIRRTAPSAHLAWDGGWASNIPGCEVMPLEAQRLSSPCLMRMPSGWPSATHCS